MMRAVIFLVLSLVINSSWAGSSPVQELKKIFPGTEIHLSKPNLEADDEVLESKFVAEVKPGLAMVDFKIKRGESVLTKKFILPFEARVKTFLAKQRIKPGERLSSDGFVVESIDVSKGMARQHKGLFVSLNTNLNQYQATQTILEGQYPLISGIKKTPDVEKGESVRVFLSSGDLKLVTMGTALEPGYIGLPLKISTVSTKKNMSGILSSDKTLEVAL